MLRFSLFALALFFGFLSLPPLWAQGKWELEKNQDGIAVYTRKTPELPIKQIRVVCELPGTPAQLVKVLKNVEHHSDWVYLNRKTVLLKQKDLNTIIYYTEADMPWPLTDRDMIAETRVLPAAKNKTVRVEVTGLPTYLPQKKNLVRIPYSLAVWEIVPVSKDRMKVEYTFSVNPGGSVPAWMVNATVATGPTITFSRLRDLLADMQVQKTK
ncbi:hypothetical protein TH63_06475 [Rufibacter radiotolerans]|uniref:START domain-containing protein n=1 Tax=Rufibacter radiotolerans TaxID=1379910 RepID=A0A0H4VNC6_9BACT|nr:START domain-containing protein [Rufibacter radiotolerans]AKQ45362.1 hypothetical protein TH63_06475 [Rufibacter radiotolerans]